MIAKFASFFITNKTSQDHIREAREALTRPGSVEDNSPRYIALSVFFQATDIHLPCPYPCVIAISAELWEPLDTDKSGMNFLVAISEAIQHLCFLY
jgi:hypothetical protein